MAYQSLYRKYRPRTFEEVVGQKHIVDVLQKSLEKDLISHAYLFCGPRATGKTSIAKIFATAINCEKGTVCGTCDNCIQALNETHSDIIEIDAASNNGVDEIRSIIERVKYAPILGKKKVYIIDEVHMLSQGAFNALLKTLEEPPEHVVFILATTEIHKVLPTIISRCQRYDFSRIEKEDMIGRLEYILQNEKMDFEPQVTSLIASVSGGGLRNALTYLEQAMILSTDKIKEEEVIHSLGMILPQEKIDMFSAIRNKDVSLLFDSLQTIKEKSIQIERILNSFLENLKDAYLLNKLKNESLILSTDMEVVRYLRTNFEVMEILKMIDIMKDTIQNLRLVNTTDIYLELLMMNLLEAVGVSDNIPLQKPSNIKPITEIEVDKPIPTDIKEEIKTPSIEKEEVKNIPTIKEETTDSIEVGNEDIQEEVIEEIIEEIPSTITDITIDEIISFMVSGEKDLRIQEVRDFADVINFRHDLKWAKISRLLSNGDVVISSPIFTVLSFKNEYEANEVMDPSNYHEIQEFIPQVLKGTKHILAITQEKFKNAVETFMQLHKENKLPGPLDETYFEKYKVQAQQIKEKDKEDPTQAVTSLFGDKVEIV